MAALTADRSTLIRAGGFSRTIVAKLAAATKIYKGAIVAKNAAGYVVPASDTAALVVIGVAQATVDNSAGANGALTIVVHTGVFKFNNLGARPVVQANMHGVVRVGDDNSVATTGGVADICAGLCEQIDSDGVWVLIDPAINIALVS